MKPKEEVVVQSISTNYDRFNIKLVEQADTESNYHISFRGNMWDASKDQELVANYLEGIGLDAVAQLNS